MAGTARHADLPVLWRRTRWAAAALLVTLLTALTLAPTTAAQPEATPEARVFGDFLARTGPICAYESSHHCVDAAWSFADRDGERRLSLTELQHVRESLGAWLAWQEHAIPPAQRRMVRLGLLLVDGIGLPALLQSYDTDGDGAVSRAELLSDLRLDARPLGHVLLDSQAVDWAAVSRRFGPIAATLESLGAKTPE